MPIEDMTAYHRERYRRERNKDPAAMSEKRRQYRLANYERLLAQERASHQRNQEKRREQAREYQRRFRTERPEEYRATQRRHTRRKKYGLTQEQWDAMLTQQGNVCAICKRANETGKEWHTDHCHTTGTVRGILCQHCNLMLGHAQDNPERLEAAARYLRAITPTE